MRKSSLELSEALNINEQMSSHKRHASCKFVLKSCLLNISFLAKIMSEEMIDYLREKYPESYFFAHRATKMSAEAIQKFDQEDLQLIGYMPYRDEFEHVGNFWRRVGEHLCRGESRSAKILC